MERERIKITDPVQIVAIKQLQDNINQYTRMGTEVCFISNMTGKVVSLYQYENTVQLKIYTTRFFVVCMMLFFYFPPHTPFLEKDSKCKRSKHKMPCCIQEGGYDNNHSFKTPLLLLG